MTGEVDREAEAAWKSERNFHREREAIVEMHHVGHCVDDHSAEDVREGYVAGYRARAAEQAKSATVSCWHCLDELIPELSLPRCDRCPAECDDENCTAEGCVREREAHPGVCPSGRKLERAPAFTEPPVPMRDLDEIARYVGIAPERVRALFGVLAMVAERDGEATDRRRT